MKKVILTLTAGIVLITSCKKEQTIQVESNETIKFKFNGNQHQYTGNQVGEINKPTTTWYTRIQSNDPNSHFELLLSDTIVGNYENNPSEITILFEDKYYKPYGNNPLNAAITSYNTIGGYIEGTFSGHARRYLGGNDTTEVDFTNGTFKVIRDFSHS